MPRLQLKLLGSFEVRIGSGAPLDIANKKTRALLAYLALPTGRAHTRDKLVGLLWSDRADVQARNSLRQALTEIGKAFGATEPSPLIKARDTLALDPATMEVDALVFEQLAASDATSDLRRAAALYAGDLLDGLDTRDAAFEEWLAAERQRLRTLAATALKKLLAHENGPSAIAVAHRLLALDPLQEEGHRALMRVHAEAGETSTALRQYELCREMLKNELDVTPSPETEALHHSIRKQLVGHTRRQPEIRPAPSGEGEGAVRADREPSKPSIAVLPFRNLGDDDAQQYFSDGITEDIITELSRFRSLFVIARNSSFQYRDKATDVTRIGRELGVQYVVEGSVRRSSDRIRITAQLIVAATATHLWAEHYDRDLRDTFAVQDEVTRTIVSMLAIRLEDEGLAAARRKPPGNMRAYDYWLRGKNCLDLWNRQALFDARACFEKAIEIEPGYARAYAGLALTYEWAAFYTAWGGGDPTARETAERYALKAVSLDATDYQPHVALGWIYQQRHDFERSRRHLDRAEALNPNDADLLINKAIILSWQGDADRAIELAQLAIRLNPYHPDWYFGYYSHCLMTARRYDEAMALRASAINIFPEARVIMAVLFVLLGRMDEARRQVDELISSFPSHWLGEPTVSFFVKLMGGYKNQADVDILSEALRKAGLPE
jgi:TolB-like protein/Tfp pilus assembly protein PilF